MLKQLREQGADAGPERESFTQIARVKAESEIEDYRELLDQQLLAQNRQAQKDTGLRVAALEQGEQRRQAQARADAEAAEKERAQRARQKQQSDLDKWTKSIKQRFEGFEW